MERHVRSRDQRVPWCMVCLMDPPLLFSEGALHENTLNIMNPDLHVLCFGEGRITGINSLDISKKCHTCAATPP